jgi:hypothetical protein
MVLSGSTIVNPSPSHHNPFSGAVPYCPHRWRAATTGEDSRLMQDLAPRNPPMQGQMCCYSLSHQDPAGGVPIAVSSVPTVASTVRIPLSVCAPQRRTTRPVPDNLLGPNGMPPCSSCAGADPYIDSVAEFFVLVLVFGKWVSESVNEFSLRYLGTLAGV